MKQPVNKSQNTAAPSRDVVEFALAVPGVQDYDTITVDGDLLLQQIDFLRNTHCSEVYGAEDCTEGIISLLEGILDLGWPPGEGKDGWSEWHDPAASIATIPGEPLQVFRGGKAVLLDNEEGKYLVRRDDGSYVMNPVNNTALFETVNEAKEAFHLAFAS